MCGVPISYYLLLSIVMDPREPRVGVEFEFKYDSMEANSIQLIFFFYNLMIGYSKKNRKNIQENTF